MNVYIDTVINILNGFLFNGFWHNGMRRTEPINP